MGVAEDVVACQAGDAAACARLQGGDGDTTSGQSVIGRPLFDLQGKYLGVLVQGGTLATGAPALFLQKPGQINRPFQPGDYQLNDGTRLQITADGNFLLLGAETSAGGGGANAAALSAQGFQQDLTFLREQERLLRERGEIDAARSLANSLVFLEQQHRNALSLGQQGLVNALALIAQEYKNALERDDINATRDLENQLTLIAQTHQDALERDDINATRDLENQLAILGETFRLRGEELEQTQEFTAEENRLSRENQVRLQRLAELSGLQRQLLSDKARGRELLAQMIGVDPIRSSALAQGIVPRGGTPADLFRGELQQTVDQPLVQPASFDIGDIESAITESQEGLGLPPQPTIGFARGGVIDMKQQGDGKFRVLVGERGPELLEGDANTIQITPIRSAAHGATIRRRPNRASFTKSPFINFSDFAGDFTFGGGRPPSRPVPTTPPTITGAPTVTGGDLPLAPAFDPTAPFVEQPQPFSVPPGVLPNPQLGGPSPFPRPGPTISQFIPPQAPPAGIPPVLGGPEPPDGEGPFAGLSVADVLTLSNAGLVSIGELVAQSLAGLPLDYDAAFAGLTVSDVLTLAQMGYTGLSQILAESLAGLFPPPAPGLPPSPPGPPPPAPGLPPPGALTQGIESIFAHLGFDQVPTFTTGPQGGMQIPRGGLSAFDRLGISPSLLRLLQPGSGGTAENFFVTPSGELQSLGLSSELRSQEALTESGFRMEDFLTINLEDFADRFGIGQFLDAPPFTGQPLATGQNPFPLPRLPLSIGPDVTGGSGFFLPDPRTIASFFRRLDPATQSLLLNFYSGAGLGGESVQRTFDFFTPSGTGSAANVAGFG